MIWIASLTVILAAIAAVFAALAWASARRRSDADAATQPLYQMLRTEMERARSAAEEQARGLRAELAAHGEALRQAVGQRLDGAAAAQADGAKQLREEITGNFRALGLNVNAALEQLGGQQKERLAAVAAALENLTGQQERAQTALRQSVEGRLDAIRAESATKLEEMRQTVDEKLQATLETRLGESFSRVVEHLERVHKGIGEMQTLAAGVGDLKRVLSSVRARGVFGEVQLDRLLVDLLAPDQFVRNARIKENSLERVEFAIRLPGRGEAAEVLLPVDAKFPQEDYERLVVAAERGDPEAVEAASAALAERITECAKAIREKYISVPKTTDFAILFLPTESLYAEALRRPGLFERIQRDLHVTLTGPTTLTALLNALQMGFRSLAIEKRSSEVWQILGAVRGAFANYNTVVDKLHRQLVTATRSAEELGKKARTVDRKLRDIEAAPAAALPALLGPAAAAGASPEAEDDVNGTGEAAREPHSRAAGAR